MSRLVHREIDGVTQHGNGRCAAPKILVEPGQRLSPLHCKPTVSEEQPFPKRGALVKNLDFSKRQLASLHVPDDAVVYCYVISSIGREAKAFIQRGTAPNFQGDRITLCTCKHWMRTFITTEQWPGHWIAGFSGLSAGGGRNSLVYLMRVGLAFASHSAILASPLVPEETKRAKAATLSRSGDFYKPRWQDAKPYAPKDYYPPVKGHYHAQDSGWHMDIDYRGVAKRRPSLLVGAPEASFLWTTPRLYFPQPIHRGQKRMKLSYLLECLEEAGS